MSILKIRLEGLVSGFYPIDVEFEKNGFRFRRTVVDTELLSHTYHNHTLYVNPILLSCSYQLDGGVAVYGTFSKEITVDIDYGEKKVYDGTFTTQILENKKLFDELDELEKVLTLELNNYISFPMRIIKAFDDIGNVVAILFDYSNKMIQPLISGGETFIREKIERQNNRLGVGFDNDRIEWLKSKNHFFENALSLYYSSFTVNDENVAFVLLVTSLEAIFDLSTYDKIEACTSCGQPKYKIVSGLSKMMSIIMMDKGDVVKKYFKNVYSKRSKFVHEGKRGISNTEVQDLQEYVRKGLLMYWYVAISNNIYDHKEIISIIKSEKYNQDYIYTCFLSMLENKSFYMVKADILNIIEKIAPGISKDKTFKKIRDD